MSARRLLGVRRGDHRGSPGDIYKKPKSKVEDTPDITKGKEGNENPKIGEAFARA